MNLRIFAILSTVIFLVIAIPMLLVEPSGSASAGIAAGFMMPLDTVYHTAVLIAIGVLAASLGEEAMVLIPVSTLLMFVIGAMIAMDGRFPAAQSIIIVSIVLFALCVRLLRKRYIVSIPPLAIWSFCTSGSYMAQVPVITTPPYFMMGVLISAFLMMGIGLSIGITLTEVIQFLTDKFKKMPAITTFLSMF